MDVYIGMCPDMGMDVYTDIRPDMCIDMGKDMCVDIPTSSAAAGPHRNTVCMNMSIDIFLQTCVQACV